MAYTVDTQKGYDLLGQLQNGASSVSASDGSVWRLDSSGNPYATRANGSVEPIVTAIQQQANQVASSQVKAASQAVSSSVPSARSYDDLLSAVQSAARSNTDASKELAKAQNDWQVVQNAKAMAFNAEQAAINREWQEYMSNTAHQREVKDLIAAGLNPVLSVTGGQGASVGSGAQASGVTSSGARGEVDKSFTAMLGNLLGVLINSQTALAQANISAKTQETVESMKEAHDTFIHQNFPSNAYQAAEAIMHYIYNKASSGKDIINIDLSPYHYEEGHSDSSAGDGYIWKYVGTDSSGVSKYKKVKAK